MPSGIRVARGIGTTGWHFRKNKRRQENMLPCKDVTQFSESRSNSFQGAFRLSRCCQRAEHQNTSIFQDNRQLSLEDTLVLVALLVGLKSLCFWYVLTQMAMHQHEQWSLHIEMGQYKMNRCKLRSVGWQAHETSFFFQQHLQTIP